MVTHIGTILGEYRIANIGKHQLTILDQYQLYVGKNCNTILIFNSLAIYHQWVSRPVNAEQFGRALATGRYVAESNKRTTRIMASSFLVTVVRLGPIPLVPQN